MEEDVKAQFANDKEDLKELKDSQKDTAKALVDMDKQSIRMEGKVDRVLAETKSLKIEVAKVNADVTEINARPLQTYRKLTWAIILGTITLAFAVITNGVMFYFSMVAKGLIK